MKTEYITLKETTLTNNCPECFSSEDLVLTFNQKKLISKLLVKTTGTIIENIHCGKCDTKIFPARYTKDIERVYDYHKKTISPNPSSIKFTGLFYALFIIVLLIISVGYIYVYHPEIFGILEK